MSKITLKRLPSTISDKEINFSNKLKNTDKEVLLEVVEYIEDYLYTSNREEEKNIEYVKEDVVMNLISKYK